MTKGNAELHAYLQYTVWIPYGYCMDTVWILYGYCMDIVWILIFANFVNERDYTIDIPASGWRMVLRWRRVASRDEKSQSGQPTPQTTNTASLCRR